MRTVSSAKLDKLSLNVHKLFCLIDKVYKNLRNDREELVVTVLVRRRTGKLKNGKIALVYGAKNILNSLDEVLK